MYIKFGIVKLYVLLVAISNGCAELCSDFDAALCRSLIEKAPNTCGDPCLSKYCKRSCGLCPLQCYECNEIADATNCSTVVECTNPNDYCFIAHTFTTHFTEAYRLGCGSRQTCLQYVSSTGTNHHRLEAGCCNKDRCNNIPPTLLKLTPEPNVTNTDINLDTDSCANQNDDVCTRISLYMVNPCDDPCIAANICPKMCKKCFKCLDCNEVTNPDACTNTTMCGLGKQCYGLEKLGKDFRPVVQLGCIDEEKCNALQGSPVHIFGKREFSFAGYCCSGERCNIRPLKDQVITTKTPVTTAQIVSSTQVITTKGPVTTAPMVSSTTPNELLTTDVSTTTEQPTVYPYYCSHNEVYTDIRTCPRHYNRYYNHACYMDSNHKFQQSDAVQYCRQNCGTLTRFSSLEEVKGLFDYLGQIHYSNYYNRIEAQFWVDMERDDHGNWFWSDDWSPVPSSIINSPHSRLPHYTSHMCAVIDVTFVNAIVHQYYLTSEYCSNNHYKICKHV